MLTFLVIIFVIACFAMIISILLQASKGQGLAGTFGGAGTSAVFGGRGAGNFLSKSTAVLAVAYMVLCLLIGYFYKQQGESVRDSLIQQESGQQAAPASAVPLAPIDDAIQDTSN
jgi:preprotein translocase subunit SecG